MITIGEYRSICKTKDYLEHKLDFYYLYSALCLIVKMLASVLWMFKDFTEQPVEGNAVLIVLFIRIVPALLQLPVLWRIFMRDKYSTLYTYIALWSEVIIVFIGMHLLRTYHGWNPQGLGWIAYYVMFYAFSLPTHLSWVFPASIVLFSLLIYIADLTKWLPCPIGSIGIISTSLFFCIPLCISVIYFKLSFAALYITSKKKEELAKRDALTGSWNRFGLDELTDKKGNTLSKCSLLLVDIDDFKIFNDIAGHDLGDEILKEVVNTANKVSRENDRVVRYGGDEFLIYLEGDVDPKTFYDRFIEEKSISLRKNGVTFSVGAVKVNKGENLYKAISHADEAMYAVKNTNKNNFCMFD